MQLRKGLIKWVISVADCLVADVCRKWRGRVRGYNALFNCFNGAWLMFTGLAVVYRLKGGLRRLNGVWCA